MATEVIMPKLGLTMEKGTIGAWLVAEGQVVAKGRPLLEVVTDKVTMEVEAQADGVLRKILVPAGEEVAVSTLVGIIGAADEKIDALIGGSPWPSLPLATPVEAPTALASAPAPAAAKDTRPKHRASPKARKMAEERGLDLGQLAGSGPGGRVVSEDVRAFLARTPAPAPTAAGPEAIPTGAGALLKLTRAQQVTGQRLTASYQQIPHIHVFMDVSGVWLQQFREGYRLQGKKISFNDLIVKAVAKALVEFPRLNSVLQGDEVRLMGEVNIGIAADTPQGLLVPVVRQVDELGIEEIAAESARLVDAARHGQLRIDDLSGGTFTISNLGMFGVSHFTAIINPPQVAILAVGAMEKRVVVLDNDAVAARPCLTLNLAADHRVVDGALAARFLQRLKEILETPGLLA
ncbi:MAG: 2-oxo acid dehydrogenase subunit E2 [Candidatus Latescibacteria bacterium]|nr:2-oxo acid dehydrogenase subunit E2 [Candidatus Latescibacterota bacterium]